MKFHTGKRADGVAAATPSTAAPRSVAGRGHRSSVRRSAGDRQTGVAAETGGGYEAREPTAEGAADRAATGAGVVLERLEQAVGEVRARPVDELDEGQLTAELEVVERVCRQLSARQARLAAARASREARRAREAARAAGRNEDAAGNAASQQVRRQLSNELGWSPSESKRAVELGRRLEPSDSAGQAFDAGQLGARHAAVLADTLRWIEGSDRRAEAQATLLAAAAREDAVAFGRTCRRLLTVYQPEGAERAADRRRARRRASMTQDPDGMSYLSARLAGLDAETVTTAFHAFRRRNADGESRSAEQAGADALVAMARAALDAGTASTKGGVRPHVTVHIQLATVNAEAGAQAPEGAWTGPLPVAEVRRLLADCSVGRLLADARSIPLEAGEATRTVPIGLRRQIEERDGGCIADGCDVAAAWCQVMHLGTPYRFGGRLTPASAALGCETHHDAYDRRGWVITWIDGRPVLHHPDRPPQGAARQGGHGTSGRVSAGHLGPASTGQLGPAPTGPPGPADGPPPPDRRTVATRASEPGGSAAPSARDPATGGPPSSAAHSARDPAGSEPTPGSAPRGGSEHGLEQLPLLEDETDP